MIHAQSAQLVSDVILRGHYASALATPQYTCIAASKPVKSGGRPGTAVNAVLRKACRAVEQPKRAEEESIDELHSSEEQFIVREAETMDEYDQVGWLRATAYYEVSQFPQEVMADTASQLCMFLKSCRGILNLIVCFKVCAIAYLTPQWRARCVDDLYCFSGLAKGRYTV